MLIVIFGKNVGMPDFIDRGYFPILLILNKKRKSLLGGV